VIRRALLALCAVSLAGPAQAAKIGAPVPDFAATALDGTPVSLVEATKAHKAVVVLFLSAFCPYANLFGDHIRQLEETYGPRGVLFVGVVSNQFETPDDVSGSAREHGYSFPLIRDERAEIADRLGAGRTPEAFVVGPDGKLRYHGWVQSKLRSPDLQRALEAILSGKRVRLAETRAFGCAIDRREHSATLPK
jgi:peroxiredoxin